MKNEERLNLADYFLFDRIREGKGERVALRFGNHTYTYRDVAARTRALTSLLIQADVRRGERILIVLPDAPPFAWSFYATLFAGAVVAMGNPDSDPAQIRALVHYTRATAVITVDDIARDLEAWMGSREEAAATQAHEELRRVFVAPRVATGEECEVDVAPFADARFVSLASAIKSAGEVDCKGRVTHRDEPAIWLFTSGSTGEPKANIHSQRDFEFNTEVYAKKTVGYREDDVSVSVPRLFFGYATGTNLMFPFAVGASVGLFSERPTPESLMRAIEMYRPTVVTNVPTMLGKLLDHDDVQRKATGKGLDFSSIRFSLSAGEALPEALLDRWLARFSSDVYDGIGSAEMFHIYASNRPGDIRPGSLGKVVEGYELKILPEEATGSNGASVSPGEIGVLWVRGDSVSHGYWLDREKSWRTFHGHWCRTGDLFRVDEAGYLYFAGRADELLKVSGQWVSPIEVEDCLLAHEGVAAAAVIGVLEEGLLKPKAFIVPRTGVSPDDALKKALQDFTKSRLAKHKYPRVIDFVTDLPKNDRGKIDRKALRQSEEGNAEETRRGASPGEETSAK